MTIEQVLEDTRAARLRTGLRWLIGCCAVALAVLVAWFVVAVIIHSAPMTVASGAGAAGVIVAWSSGYAAIRAELARSAARADGGATAVAR